MSRLKNPKQPPALYFVVSLGGKARRIPYKGTSPTLDMLHREVVEVYLANSDPIPDDLKTLIEAQVCSRNPIACWPSDPTQPQVSQTKRYRFKLPSLSQAVSASKAILEQAQGKVEPQSVIEARANI